jgi:hypothetical protein
MKSSRFLAETADHTREIQHPRYLAIIFILLIVMVMIGWTAGFTVHSASFPILFAPASVNQIGTGSMAVRN